jgi:ABC-type multidrug transport system fused ATPase/permease subunit
MKGRTIVNITHKLESLKGKDKIVLVDQGRVAEEGSYNDLMARDGEFAGMVIIRLTQTLTYTQTKAYHP